MPRLCCGGAAQERIWYRFDLSMEERLFDNFVMYICMYVFLLGREAMVVIRGSKSTMDWAINFDEAVEDFQYYLSPTHCVQGKAHRGILQVLLFVFTFSTIRILTL